MKAQIAQLWADTKAWIGTHPAISFLSATVVVLFLIALAR